MNFHRLTVATLCVLTASMMAPTSKANDIVDFLRAINGSGHDGHRHGRGHGHRFEDHHSDHFDAHHVHRPTPRYFGPRHRSVSVNFGGYGSAPRYRTRVIPVIAPVVPPVPVIPPYREVLPHRIGEIVTCPVHVMPNVIVRNANEIHPYAQPIVVAVRDPHLAAWGSPGCTEQLVYVEVYAPPCAPEEIKVSPCHTKIELDYGDWEIEITSMNGCVTVSYDD